METKRSFCKNRFIEPTKEEIINFKIKKLKTEVSEKGLELKAVEAELAELEKAKGWR